MVVQVYSHNRKFSGYAQANAVPASQHLFQRIGRLPATRHEATRHLKEDGNCCQLNTNTGNVHSADQGLKPG